MTARRSSTPIATRSGRPRPARHASCRVTRPIRLVLGILAAGWAFNTAGAAPGVLSIDPAIATLLDEVSADSLQATVQTLQDFSTRHTNSDTSSVTMGVGAARNWVHDRFAAISAASGGAVQPGFFDWQAEICSVTGSHRNVLATISGAGDPDRLFVVGAHLDSRTTDVCNAVSFAPGANDDGSGIACLIEEARLLHTLSPDATVIFQAFTGEEQGLHGSEAYTAHAGEGNLDIAGMINNDTIGNVDGCPDSPDCGGGPATDADSTSVRCFSGDPATASSRQLARLAKLIGEAYVPEMTVHLIPLLDRPTRGGDHIPFYEHGYPAIRFIETLENTQEQHSSNDLIDHMEFSYLARNVRINLALLANLCLAPPTPTGLQVFDRGTGGTIRATWSPVIGTPDLAGYRVAYRYLDGDSLYYADIVDAGAGTSVDISGLTDGVTVAVSVSSYDTGGHESIFSPEKLITPETVPQVPVGFAVESRSDRMVLTWGSPVELDLDRYRIYRGLNPEFGLVLVDSLDATEREWVDLDVLPGTDYFYKLQSVDLDGLESPPTPADKGRIPEHAFGILLVDATLDGTGTLGYPTDAMVDDYYHLLLQDYPIAGEWDWNESLAESGTLLRDADMGRYRTVVLHSDLRHGTIAADSTDIRQYLANGGQVWLTGWNLKSSLGGDDGELAVFGPGSFFHDAVHIDSLRTSIPGENDFRGALPLQSGYPSLAVDTVKWPFDGGHLRASDALAGDPLDLPETVALYAYDSDAPAGPNDGQIDALMFPAVGPKLFFTDFPLYFLQETGARELAIQVLDELGYGPASVGGKETAAGLRLVSEPNPFVGTTSLAFRLDATGPVRMRIYDVQGRSVRRLIEAETGEPGWHRVEWNGRDDQGRDVGSGVYFLVLRTPEASRMRTLTRIR
jgi:hypothetical protein